MRTHVSRATLLASTVFLALATSVAPPELQAQNRDRGDRNREEMEQRFRRQMTRLIQDRLGLDDEESARLSEVVSGFEGRRRELGRAERAVRQRVEDLVGENPQNGGEAERLLTRMIELRQEESRLYAEEQAALLEVLTPMQVLQLQALRAEMGRRIRSLRGGDGRRRGGDHGRGGLAARFSPGPGAF